VRSHYANHFLGPLTATTLQLTTAKIVPMSEMRHTKKENPFSWRSSRVFPALVNPPTRAGGGANCTRKPGHAGANRSTSSPPGANRFTCCGESLQKNLSTLRHLSIEREAAEFSDAAWGPYDKAMKTTPSQSRITVDPGKYGGRPCIRHMRMRVEDVLEMLASGAGEDQILADYPDLEREDIRACLEYAAQYVDHPVFVG
jgi:uncharacterized protein (DUF433 family)